MNIISTEKQKSIVALIDTLCLRHTGMDEERRHMLFIGVQIGLGVDSLPPFWVMNIQCGRTDRITLASIT